MSTIFPHFISLLLSTVPPPHTFFLLLRPILLYFYFFFAKMGDIMQIITILILKHKGYVGMKNTSKSSYKWAETL
jgi:hypothetical protein